MQVAGGPSDGLYQRALRAQKALFVGIQNRHQAHLWNVQPLAQEVDADQDIECAKA